MSSDVHDHVSLNIDVLGHLTVMRGGVRRELPRSRKTRGLVAYLAVTRRVHRRDDLCALFWEGATDPRSELRWSLTKIRAVIGTALGVSADGVGLAQGSVSVDAAVFRSVADQPIAEQGVADALNLWRGVPLADVEVDGQPAFQAWVAAEREALSTIRTNLLKAAVDFAWANPERALVAARRLVAHEPWNEWGHARVVQLLERFGRMAEARDFGVYSASIERRV
jgi:DNA-binding SARP family transcriptional activator